MSFNSALSGLQTSNDQLRVLSNNIANSSTPGYKKSRADFSDVFAAGALGASSNIIGTGVKVANISQQFTQGIIQNADTNLDLAINGSGFFVLDKDGSRLYSRAGAFFVDKDGNISNSQRQKLIGFLTDANGNITGAQGTLSIQNSSLNPKASDAVSASLNLDSQAIPPANDFVPGFVPGNPPASTTFNNSASTQIYDSLGNPHILTSFFVKSPAERTWQVYYGLDGTDITPVKSSVPAGGTPNAPTSYATTDLASPFTLVFDQGGQLIINNSAAPPRFYGNPPVNSIDVSTNLVDVGAISHLSIGDLTINGIPIAIRTITDNYSTAENVASAITLVDAINASTASHKVTATRVQTTFDVTGGTYGATALAADDLTINGIQIIGTPAAATAQALADLINGSNGGNGVPGVLASVSGGQLRLVAADARNIQLQSSGNAGVGINFGNFNLSGGTALNKVKRGALQLTINNNRGITIGGNNPAHASLTPGTLAGIFQTNSDILDITFNPGTGATSPQSLSIDLNNSTQFASPFSITALTQNGYSTGRLTGVDVDPGGIITARFGNGQSQQLGQVSIANFRNTQGLQPQGDTAWSETFSSGVALLGAPGTSDLGLIQSGSLENSNVQLTDELVALIVAQRNFQANAQTIRTADAVTQTIINIR